MSSLALVPNDRRSARWLLALLIALALGIMTAFAVAISGATKTAVVLSALAAMALPLGVAALRRPLIVPFAAYAFCVPFDNLLAISSFGSMTRLLAIASGGAVALWILRYRRWQRPQASLWWWSALILWGTVTLFWAIDTTAATSMLQTYAQLFLLYAVLSLYPSTNDDLRWVLGAVSAGGIVAAAYGVYLFETGADMHAGNLFVQTDNATIDPNHFSAALLLPLALVLGYALSARRLWPNAAAYAATAVILLAIYASGSRGALVASAAVFVWFFLRTPHRMQLTLVASAVVIGVALNSTSLMDRVSQALATGGSGRTDIWRVGLNAFAQHWFVGAGVGNFPFAYDEAFMKSFSANYVHWHRVAHDLLLSTAVELGIVGAIILVIAWYRQFRSLEVITRSHAFYGVRVAVEAALIGIFVAGLFLDLIWYKYAWLAFSVAAIAVAAATRTAGVEHRPITRLEPSGAANATRSAVRKAG